jgi:hypothetical protein
MQKSQFFSQQNKNVLKNFLQNDYQKRNGIPLNESFSNRLNRTLEHYMNEVYTAQPNAPVGFLNKEVLTITVQDFTAFLKRQNTVSATAAKPVKMAAQTSMVAVSGTLLSDLESPLLSDTASLFDRVQKERNNGDGRPMAPPIPDFRIALDENSPPALELYEMAKKAREQENKFQQQQQTPISNPTIIPSIQTNINTKPIEPQQILIKQDDIIKYKEIENNLIIYSADRDWLRNTQENRYNFTVNFDQANNTQGFGANPSAQHRFKNITRIEFVKAILPVESIDIVQRRNDISSYNTDLNINVLGLPYIRLHIDELESNNYGTSNELDHTFGILQYDAVWTSDTATQSRGYTAMIPKFIKCERKYAPTPLATLNKLSIQLERPEGGLLSKTPDTIDIVRILPGIDISSSPTIYRTTAGNSEYYFMKTAAYFNHLTAQTGNRVLFKNVTVTAGTATQQTRDEFQNFINRSEGHLVVGVAYDFSGSIYDGTNSVGYSNYIIIRGQYEDPSTGSTSIRPFGGSNTQNAALAVDLLTAQINGRGLNLNQQLQLIFRVITRELDSSTSVRPDNL